jgi:glutamate/tyrosine decarboxylase-like PLP-dependent enzyme
MSLETIESHLDSLELPEPYAHFARAFRGPLEVQELGKRACMKFMSDNGFFSLYAPYMQTIEQEVLAMGVSLLHPGETSTGNFTSGGTESNFSGMHAARNWAREKYPHITKPNIVAPHTIHPSFQKGASYLGMEVITTPIDANGRGIAANIDAAIDENTVMLSGSAPSWHFANIDPIPRIAAIAEERDLWMHVDACVGGYLSPFFERLGVELTPWDFRVPGVRSISADLHKYGYAPKPASTIYWREADYQRYHYVTVEDQYLGQYKLAGFSGTRSAGPIFAAWSVMNYLGEEGYLKLARHVLDMKAQLTERIEAIDGLKVWDIDVMPMQFHSEKAPTQAIYGGMSEKGWALLGLQEPEAITICLDGAMTQEIVDLFMADLSEVTRHLLAGGDATQGDIRYS